jgi:hypothetical protein
MRTFLHSGGLGDIIYSLPAVKRLGGGVLYVKHSNRKHRYCDQFEIARELLEQQPYILTVKPYDAGYDFFEYDPAVAIDFDLDLSRVQARRLVDHHILSYLRTFKQAVTDWEKPWLHVDDTRLVQEPYNLVHVTPRWRDGSSVNWSKILERLELKTYFVGLGYEWLDFSIKYGQIEHYPTENLLQLARLINHCEALYCNQSVALTIAQGLGKKYYLEKNPKRDNCIMHSQNENLL